MAPFPSLDASDKTIVIVGILIGTSVILIFGGGGVLMAWAGFWEAATALWLILSAFLVWVWRRLRRSTSLDERNQPVGAAIHFEYQDRTYVYTGEDPADIAEDMAKAEMELTESAGFPPHKEGDWLSPMRAIIERMGGRITKVEGLRPDGTIRIDDLPDYKIH